METVNKAIMDHNQCVIHNTAWSILHVFDAHSGALVYNYDAMAVGHLQDLLSVRVVTGAERVCAHPLHQVEIFHDERPVKALPSNLPHKRKRLLLQLLPSRITAELSRVTNSKRTTTLRQIYEYI